MPDNAGWGPGNPHPLSQMRTELVWEGKYDEYGRRREVDIAGSAMPLQRIETVDEPASRLPRRLGHDAGTARLLVRAEPLDGCQRRRTDSLPLLLLPARGYRDADLPL
jgi:hypothetical protein